MLVELRVENYAVIDNVVVEFAPGLNLLTGETGAGKSILIDALALLLGGKASPEVIRHGADKAVVAAVFEIAEGAAATILEANGLDDAGSELILRREITAGGRGRVFINNQPAIVAVLKQLAPLLAAIHAQNESLVGFDAEMRRELLDGYAGIGTGACTEAFARWKEVRARIAELEQDEHDRLRLVDLWSFQKKEIEAARLQAGEDEKLEAEKRVLANAEKIYGAAMGAYELLYEGDASAAAAIRAASRQIADLVKYDAQFQDSVAALDAARITVEDLGATLRDYAGGINASPERLAEIEDRLAVLDRLKRKYGNSVEEVMAFGDAVSRKLQQIENKDESLRQLRAELTAAEKKYLAGAGELSRKRAAAAARLEKDVEREVNELAMKARFRIEVTAAENSAGWTADGFDSVAYLIATNAGQPLGPIEDIASGGELSRVMLALKAVVESSGNHKPPRRPPGWKPALRTIIFDEVDTGIGGRAAEAVGKKLKGLARGAQVLCITHLPQIASFADHHYVIEKRESAGKTRTSVRRLEGTERTQELARMLSGAKVSETSLKHAEQLLKANHA